VVLLKSLGEGRNDNLDKFIAFRVHVAEINTRTVSSRSRAAPQSWPVGRPT
jgi:hypothetical protein